VSELAAIVAARGAAFGFFAFIFWVVIVVVFCYWGAKVVTGKGYNMWIGIALAFFLSWIGIIICYVLPKKQTTSMPMAAGPSPYQPAGPPPPPPAAPMATPPAPPAAPAAAPPAAEPPAAAAPVEPPAPPAPPAPPTV
jgi:hypothetical protein